ncbi:uncharacterized protein LOC143185434 isoform X2 [Calliopsis andreniformis]
MITSSEGFFFEFPKKILMNLWQSLKEKKEAKKWPHHVQHYHVHYYPHVIYEPPVKAPKKHELEDLHHEHLSLLGWSDHEYKYIPEPKIRIPSKIKGAFFEASPWEHEILESDLPEIKAHSEDEAILVEVPINQKIIIEPGLKKSKSSLWSALFHKFDSKNDLHS